MVITRREEMKKFLADKKYMEKKIGFVPTMGALHAGHGKLIDVALSETDLCIVSIFVNPIQFGPKEDLSKYPRQFQKDFELCETKGVHVIFAPSVDEMYPTGFSTEVSVKNLSNFLCGKFRPGHFNGVATVVFLLLNIIRPHVLYLGQKDIQQVQVIKQMVLDLACWTSIVTVPTLREEDGLAMSSRNVYLNPEMRKLASSIPKALAHCAQLYLGGERSCEKILEEVQKLLTENNLVPQYLELRSLKNLANELSGVLEEDAVLAIAQFIEPQETNLAPVRLIDNLILSEDSQWIKVLKEFSDYSQSV